MDPKATRSRPLALVVSFALGAGSLGLAACFSSSTNAGPPASEEPSDAGPGDATTPGDAGGPGIDAAAYSSDAGSPAPDASPDAGGEPAAPAPGACVATGSMSVARSFALSGTLADGRVLVAGGAGALATAEIYDPATGTFSPTGSLTVGRWGYPNPLVRLQDGRFLVAGGSDTQCQNVLSSAEIYDPTAGSWAATDAMTTGRANPILVGVGSGQVLVLGGYGAAWGCNVVRGYALTSAELYDPASGKFSQTGSAASPRAAAASAALPGGSALVVDGESYGNSPFNSTAEIFTPGADAGPGGGFTWSATVPGAAGYSSVFLLASGQVLLSGSYSGGTFSLFDPAMQTFSTATQDLISAGGGCSVRLRSGDVFFATGDMGGVQSPQTEVYRAASGTWTQLGNMSTSRWVCSIAELPDGNVLVAGGNDANGTTLKTAEICNPRVPAPDGGVLADSAPE